MKTTLALCAAVLLFAGCVVPSLQPLIAEKDYVAYSELTGSWVQTDDEKLLYTFAADGKAYKLTQVDEKQHTAVFRAVVGKLGTNVFLDTSIEDPKFEDRVNDFAVVHLVPGHVFVKVTQRDNQLVFTALDVTWLKDLLRENPKAIAHVMQEERPILTATTEELQKFVIKYAADTNAFKNEIILKRKGTATANP